MTPIRETVCKMFSPYIKIRKLRLRVVQTFVKDTQLKSKGFDRQDSLISNWCSDVVLRRGMISNLCPPLQHLYFLRFTISHLYSYLVFYKWNNTSGVKSSFLYFSHSWEHYNPIYNLFLPSSFPENNHAPYRQQWIWTGCFSYLNSLVGGWLLTYSWIYKCQRAGTTQFT